MTQQLIDDLKAARQELVTRGRCTKDLVSDDGRVCALGAVGVAVVENFIEMHTYDDVAAFAEVEFLNDRTRAVVQALCDHLPVLETLDHGVYTEPLWRFNDKQSTTDRDVLNLFDKALADLGGLA